MSGAGPMRLEGSSGLSELPRWLAGLTAVAAAHALVVMAIVSLPARQPMEMPAPPPILLDLPPPEPVAAATSPPLPLPLPPSPTISKPDPQPAPPVVPAVKPKAEPKPQRPAVASAPPKPPAAQAPPRPAPPPVAAAAPEADSLGEPQAAPPAETAAAPNDAAPSDAAPSDAAPATAAGRPGSSGRPAGGSDAKNDWQRRLVAQLERHKRYPRSAQLRRAQGVAYLNFTVDQQGRVVAFALARSSGDDALDSETLALVERAQPLPPPPPELGSSPLQLTVPVRFFLR